jgi:hypothetical protein
MKGSIARSARNITALTIAKNVMQAQSISTQEKKCLRPTHREKIKDLCITRE